MSVPPGTSPPTLDATPACPSLELIERLANGETVASSILAHIPSCPRCKEALESARDDAAFLTRARTLAAPSLGSEGAPRIPGYGHLRTVSSGAQGTVYKAVQESTQRAVAIKVLSKGSTSSRQLARAQREAEIAARLRHPNIVTVFESRTLSDGRTAVIMEFIDGVAIDAWQPRSISAAARERELLRVFIAVCNAIHHAHLNGVIHRDLKPDNILVTAAKSDSDHIADDSKDHARPVVLDFGIAKAGGIQATITGEFAGTPAYASPEQVAGKPEGVDALTDVYSLGVILYRLLCGTMPYEVSGSIFDIARTISETPPTPPREHNANISQDLESIILRALRKDKTLRYQSAASLARDVERYLTGDPVDARSGSGWYLLRKAVAVNRSRLVWAAAFLLLLVGAGVAVAISLATAAESARKAAQEREQAKAESTRARAVTELLREALPNSSPDREGMGSLSTSGFSRLYMRLESGAFADDPDLDYTLRRLWGGIYTGFGSGKAAGMVEYAEVSLRNGLARLRAEHGDTHPTIASSMHELAGVLLVRKRYPEAESICRDTLAMREKLFGPATQSAAESRALLARILYAGKKSTEAAAQADAALAILATLPQRESDLPIAAMHALKARILLDASDYKTAEPLLTQALTRRLRTLPPEDIDLAATLADAADFIEQCPDCELARLLSKVWQRPLADTPAAIRDDLPKLRASNRDYFVDSDNDRATALITLFHLQTELFGRDDPAVITTLLAIVRAAEGERRPYLKAEAAIRASQVLEKHFGRNDFTVLMSVEEAASVLGITGKPEKAYELQLRAVEIWEALPPHARDPLLLANCRRYCAMFLALAGRYEEAIPAHLKSIDELSSAVGAHHHTVYLSKATLGLCYAAVGQMDEADRITRESLDAIASLPATPRDVRNHITAARGHILRLQGHHQQSSELLAPIFDMNYRNLHSEFAWRRTLLEDLIANAAALHDTAGEQKWRAELAKKSVEKPFSLE